MTYIFLIAYIAVSILSIIKLETFDVSDPRRNFCKAVAIFCCIMVGVCLEKMMN